MGQEASGKTRLGQKAEVISILPSPSFSPRKALCWVSEATPAGPSPHLPDVVQELRGGEAVLRAGELAAVVLEEGQQVGLQVKQPVGGGPASSLSVSPCRPQ